jgi:hypothetical protein
MSTTMAAVRLGSKGKGVYRASTVTLVWGNAVKTFLCGLFELEAMTAVADMEALPLWEDVAGSNSATAIRR